VFEFPAINRFRMMRALDQRLHQAGLAHCFDWGGALVRAFKRGAEKARALPQPDGIAANGSLKPTIGRAA
jgi:hypothetical protein